MSDEQSDLSYIAFKDEGTTDGGEPIGPVSFVTKADEELTGVAALMGGPREECECQEPECEPGERCRRCGKENERWVTLSQAEEIARRRGWCFVRNSVLTGLRRCGKRRARQRSASARAAEYRITGRGNRIDVSLLRAFLKRTLEDDAVADSVNDLLFEHVVAGRFHRSVVAENLPSYVDEVLRAATSQDWQAVADELIAEAREVNGEV